MPELTIAEKGLLVSTFGSAVIAGSGSFEDGTPGSTRSVVIFVGGLLIALGNILLLIGFREIMHTKRRKPR